jgi:hypothetical protein
MEKELSKITLQEKIRLIKLSRLKPEERFLINIFHNVIEYKIEEYPDDLFFIYNNELIFDLYLINNDFRISYIKIWEILKLRFNLNHQQSSLLIKSLVEEHLINDINPVYLSKEVKIKVEYDLKLKKLQLII